MFVLVMAYLTRTALEQNEFKCCGVDGKWANHLSKSGGPTYIYILIIKGGVIAVTFAHVYMNKLLSCDAITIS